MRASRLERGSAFAGPLSHNRLRPRQRPDAAETHAGFAKGDPHLKHIVWVAAVALLAAGCSGSGANPSRSAAGLPAVLRASSSPIKHVVFIIQENRSFNNLFMGYPGALTQNYGYDQNGTKIALHAQRLHQNWDMNHSSVGFFAACDGQGSQPGTDCKMDGWNAEGGRGAHPKNFAYAYVPQKEIAPYWDMARQYVLADHMFPSNLDGSYVSHQFAVAGYASSAIDYPTTTWGCQGGPSDTIQTLTKQRTYGPSIPACFTHPTIAGEADTAGVTWHYYTGAIYGDGNLWNTFAADSAVYNGPDWSADVISPPSRFLTDIAAGQLSKITWITPTGADSDHPGFVGNGGPAWVASLVNAVGKSSFWKSTAIFVMWDDPGGWFDPVKPPHKDYDGFGFRVPLIVISPYAKQGYVTHVQYETASVLRFMEDNFGLAPLAASDGRANDPAGDALDYSQAPRAFTKIAGAKPNAYWIREDRLSAHRALPQALMGSD